MQLSASILLASSNAALPADLASSRSCDDSSESTSSTARDFGDLLNDQESSATATPATTQNPKSVASRKASSTTYQSESDDSALEADSDQEQSDPSASATPSVAWMLANGLIGLQPPATPTPLPPELSGSITLDVSAADGTAENAEYSSVAAEGTDLVSFDLMTSDQPRLSLPAGLPSGEFQSNESAVTSARQCVAAASSEDSFSPDAASVSPLTAMAASVPAEADDEVSLSMVESFGFRSTDSVSNQASPAVSCYQQLTTQAQIFAAEADVDRSESSLDLSAGVSADPADTDTEGVPVNMNVAPTSLDAVASLMGPRVAATKLWAQMTATDAVAETATVETESSSVGLTGSPPPAKTGTAQLLNQEIATDLATAKAKIDTDRVSVNLNVPSGSTKTSASTTAQRGAAARLRNQVGTTGVTAELAPVDTAGVSTDSDVATNLVATVSSATQAPAPTAKLWDQTLTVNFTTERAKTGADSLPAAVQVAPKSGEAATASTPVQPIAATTRADQVAEIAVEAGTVEVEAASTVAGSKVDPRSGKLIASRTGTSVAVSRSGDLEARNQESGAKIAAAADRSVALDESTENGAIKKSQEKDYDDLTDSSTALGTNAAKAIGTMSAHAATAETSSSTDVSAALSVAATSGSATVANDTTTSATAETASAARSAVESVLAVADHFATTGGQHGVNLKFTVSGIELAVRVEIRGDQLQTTFRTDSAELRSALANEWKAVASEAGDRTERVAAPVFTSSSGNDAFSSNSGGSDQRGAYAQQDETSFARLAAEARGTLRVAAAAPTAVSSLSSTITEPETIAGRLHVLV